MEIIPFEMLPDSDLIIDAVYEGGNRGNAGDDPLSKLMKVGNSGGFRAARDSEKNIAYINIYTSGEDVNWPDYINKELGVVRYYGDNKKAGNSLRQTKANGNKYLERLFDCSDEFDWKNMPVFAFKKYPTRKSNRSIQFVGLLVPNVVGVRQDELLKAIWRTDNEGNRFQNYEANFSILDTGMNPIKREWIDALLTGASNQDEFAPPVWLEYKKKQELKNPMVLQAERTKNIRTKSEQLPKEGSLNYKMLKMIKEKFKDNPIGFEEVAIDIVKQLDSRFYLEPTRGVKDGGIDGVGHFQIGTSNSKVSIPCYLEAKCFDLNNGVGVKQTSRLISRLKKNDFGVFVTTSYIHSQSYSEIIEDGHKVLILSGIDIIEILKKSGINNIENMEEYLSGFGDS